MNHISLADPKDVVIAISESGTSKSVVQAAGAVNRKRFEDHCHYCL